MSLIDHWPLAATIGWLIVGSWLIVQKQKAQKPLPEGKGMSPGREAFRRLLQNPAAKYGGTVAYFMIFACLLGPWIIEVMTGITYKTADFNSSELPPAWWQFFGYSVEQFAPSKHIFGTDFLGRDVFVRVLVGGRISLSIGVTTALIATSIGIVYGATAGYVGGRVDQVMMRVVDVLYSLPYMTLVIVVMAFFGRNVFVLFAAIGFVGWLTLARITRGQILSLKEKEFVEAAVATGTKGWKIVLFHLIPNALGPVTVYTTLIVPRIMMEEAFLSFLGFGIRPPLSSWGTLVSEGVEKMREAPWLIVFPILFLTGTLYSLNYLGDGVRDALDPKVPSYKPRKKHSIKRATTAARGGHLLEVLNFTVEFDALDGGNVVRAASGVSFRLMKGETLAIVGESGSGKSVTARAILGLDRSPPCYVMEGAILLDGHDLLHMSERDMRAVRGGRVSMVFQDPMTALNPYHTVGRQLREVLLIHTDLTRKQARQRCIEMLRKVGIPEPEVRMKQYPHELSGGMQQRVMIAMALLTEPEILIADEPTTALDVTIQAQILTLLKDLQKELRMAIILITHDLGIVGEMADNVVVMYAGRIVEAGTVRDILQRPQHPYTQGLLRSLPTIDGKRGKLLPIAGQPPNLRKLPPGCAFEPRCSFAHDGCRQQVPAARVFSETHAANCVKREVAA